MRSNKILFALLITSMLLLPFINFATAAPTPNYVGIEEGDEIIWDVYINPGQYQDYIEDLGFSEEFADNYTDELFDDELNDDVVGWKIKILELEEEDESHDEEFVEYKYKLYTREDEADWEVEDKKDDKDIWKFDDELYAEQMFIAIAFAQIGIISSELIPFVVANNVKWGKTAEELDDELDKEFDKSDESAGAEVATDMYFFTQKENGISIFANGDEDKYEDFTIVAQFNDDGILMYYNLAYDDDTIIELELQYRLVYIWWWAAVVVAVAAVVIVIVIIVIKRR